MGDILNALNGTDVGAAVAGAGVLAGGAVAQGGYDRGADQARTGYNYLSQNPGVQGAVNNINPAQVSETGLLNQQRDLLSGGAAAKNAFAKYLGSTGFNFQRQQGQQAITGSAAARGLLGSGGTGKALATFGNNLATQGFNNYFGQLGQAAGGYGGQVKTGLGAAEMTGQAGTQGGIAAGNLTGEGGAAMGNALGITGMLAGSAIAGDDPFNTNSSTNTNYFASNPGGAYMGTNGNWVPGAQGFQ